MAYLNLYRISEQEKLAWRLTRHAGWIMLFSAIPGQKPMKLL